MLITTKYLPLHPINCPQKGWNVQNLEIILDRTQLGKLEVEHYVNNYVQINQELSSNTNNLCNNRFISYSNCCPIKEKEMSFPRLHKPWISDTVIISIEIREHELLYKTFFISNILG